MGRDTGPTGPLFGKVDEMARRKPDMTLEEAVEAGYRFEFKRPIWLVTNPEGEVYETDLRGNDCTCLAARGKCKPLRYCRMLDKAIRFRPSIASAVPNPGALVYA